MKAIGLKSGIVVILVNLLLFWLFYIFLPAQTQTGLYILTALTMLKTIVPTSSTVLTRLVHVILLLCQILSSS